jgi:type IV pilus assembly protein PilV
MKHTPHALHPRPITHPGLRQRRRARGATMIEVLVSIIIFAFGVLGFAGLQLRALASNQSSLQRSQAAVLVDDVMDRMRVDRANALAGGWNIALGTSSASVGGSSLTQTDLRDWLEQVEQLLPGGQAAIQVNNGEVRVTLAWRDERGQDDVVVFPAVVSRL